MTDLKEGFGRYDHLQGTHPMEVGHLSRKDFKRREMEHELRHETTSSARPKQPLQKATGMIYHPAGSKTDKNGKKYDFHNGDAASGHAAAKAKGGKFSEFKPKTLKEFVVEADAQLAPMKLSGKVDKVEVDPDISELADADDDTAGKVETT